MKIKNIIGILIILIFISIVTIGQASALLMLPDPYTTAMQYGDAFSYSLPVLNYIATGDTTQNTGDPYYVDSSPGQIKNYIVVATGAGGQDINTNFPNMDNAYPTPSGVHGSPIFSTRNTPDPGQVTPFSGDSEYTWDTSLSALIDYLTVDNTRADLVFFFNNNQENSGGAENQNLFVWAQAVLVDVDGVLLTKYYDFTSHFQNHFGTPPPFGNPYAYSSPGAANSNYPYPNGGNWPSFNDFVLSGGQVCIDKTTYYPVPCGSPNATDPMNHNLGANQAAYAVFAPELNDNLETFLGFGYDVMQLDIRMSWLNNGYEQIFIMPAEVDWEPPYIIPEPGTLMLLGMGLLGLGLFGRKRLNR